MWHQVDNFCCLTCQHIRAHTHTHIQFTNPCSSLGWFHAHEMCIHSTWLGWWGQSLQNLFILICSWNLCRDASKEESRLWGPQVPIYVGHRTLRPLPLWSYWTAESSPGTRTAGLWICHDDHFLGCFCRYHFRGHHDREGPFRRRNLANQKISMKTKNHKKSSCMVEREHRIIYCNSIIL